METLMLLEGGPFRRYVALWAAPTQVDAWRKARGIERSKIIEVRHPLSLVRLRGLHGAGVALVPWADCDEALQAPALQRLRREGAVVLSPGWWPPRGDAA